MRRLVAALALPLLGWGQHNLADASLEQLLNTQVTSVTKKEQTLSRAAAAVFVISADDIRRSGALNLPDLLRMVPGVYVAQIDANAWAITIRGFNSRYSNKVLVMIDGRSVYTPTFSGVYWDQLEMPLENIERIEVIRGPGGSAWGANAVNGVISIITKDAAATQGGLATADAGTQGTAGGLVQYGARSGRGSFRAFSKYYRVGNSRFDDGSPAADGWSRLQGGFRADWQLSPRDSLTAEGDLFSNRGSQMRYQWFVPIANDPIFAQRVDSAGGSLLANFNHTFTSGSSVSLRGYVDNYRRDDFGLPESARTFDVEAEHRFTAGRHDVIWGLGYRLSHSGLAPGYFISLDPPMSNDSLYSGFVQDEIRLAPGLWLTPGVRLEHNAYTGFENEPSLRLAWAPTSRQTFWAAASKAIRQPSRQEIDIRGTFAQQPLGPYALLQSRLYGNPRFQSEQLRDAEAGYRRQISRSLSLDTDLFFSNYRHLATDEPQAPVTRLGPAGVLIVVPVIPSNLMRAVGYGGDLALTYTAGSRWRLVAGYSFLDVNSTLLPGSHALQAINQAENTPRTSAQLRASINLSRTVSWDHTLYFYGPLDNGSAPQHARFDTRLAWKWGERTEFSLVGQNLLCPGQMEFADSFAVAATQTRRAVYGKVSWTF